MFRLKEWQGDSEEEPWNHFQAAYRYINTPNSAQAIAELRRILATPELESRHYLQAWHILRSLGVKPSQEEASLLLGVVVEVGMPQGTDILAAYQDHRARYYNFYGAVVIWERPAPTLDAAIDRLLTSAEPTARTLGGSDIVRPGPPPKGQMRISFLTPSGIGFGQAWLQDFENDPLARDIVSTATALMIDMMELTKK